VFSFFKMARGIAGNRHYDQHCRQEDPFLVCRNICSAIHETDNAN